MVELASFYTTPTSPTSQAGVGNNKGASQQQGAGIFDLLLAQIEQQISNGEEKNDLTQKSREEILQANKDAVKTSEGPIKNDDAKMNLLRALAGNQGVADDVAHLDDIAELDLLAEIEHTLALNQQIFDNAIEAGTGNDDLLIDKETGEIIVPDVAKTLNLLESGEQLLSGDINKILENIDLNTANLTPAQITLLQDIQNNVVPTEAQLKEAQAILSGFVAITPAATQAAIQTTGKSEATLGTAANTNSKAPPLPFNADQSLDGDINFEQALKNAAGQKYAGNAALSGDAGTNTNAKGNAAAQTLAQGTFDVLQAWPFAANGSLFGSASYSDQAAEQLGLSLNGTQSVAQGSLSALVNQAQSAAHPHPATQMVAATLTKGGKGGLDTNISLRLDPPGLGRVEVEMTFAKDKTMKAVVIAEKPETYMMLQRDAQVLERALQDAGLDADSGLSFELAQDGSFFDDHNQRGGGHNQGGTGRGGDGSEELELIESTMTWRVDPETGHTRYNILA